MKLIPGLLLIIIIAVVPAWLNAAVSWRNIGKQPAEWYASSEALTIAQNIVAYQRESGGWTKNRSMLLPPPADYWLGETHEQARTTIDNGGTTTQLHYLAQVLSAQPDDTLRASFDRGLDYVFAAQYENGGWPQFYPLIKGYYTRITYNDNAMVNVLSLLRDVSRGKAPYGFVDEARRERATKAVEKGIACILKTQVRQHGKLTVWCAQHHEETLAPASARNFEPVSLSGMESVGIVQFLMKLDDPSPEVIAAVQGAVAWFESTKVTGLRVDYFKDTDGATNTRAVPDDSAPVIWARFYDLETNKPIYVGRDKIVRHDYNEIERERRVGYSYLSNYAETLLARDYPRWLKQIQTP